MRQIMIRVVLLTVFLLFALIVNSSAKGFSTILEEISKVESALKRLETKQNKDLKNIRKILVNKKANECYKNSDSLFQSLALLSEKIDELEKLNRKMPDNSELKLLKAEVHKLYNRLQAVENSAQEKSRNTEPDAPNIEYSGFVDASYFYDGNSGENTFGLDQVEIDLKKSFGTEGSLRADLEWVSDGQGGFLLEAEQGYLTYNPSILGPVSLTMGKFNAPIGFELLDAPDMYQYSHALVFDHGLPTNFSGVMLSSALGSGFDLSVYACNGWDQNVDINKGKTVGGRLGYASGENWAGGLSLVHGAQAAAEGDFLTVFDADISVTAVQNLILGAEFNNGSNSVADTSFKWNGIMLMAHYDFTDILGLTFRYDYFHDKDGSRLGTAEKRQALTLAPTFVLGNGMGALFEIRSDFSDVNVFFDKDGKAVKSKLRAALEFTFTF